MAEEEQPSSTPSSPETPPQPCTAYHHDTTLRPVPTLSHIPHPDMPTTLLPLELQNVCLSIRHSLIIQEDEKRDLTHALSLSHVAYEHMRRRAENAEGLVARYRSVANQEIKNLEMMESLLGEDAEKILLRQRIERGEAEVARLKRQLTVSREENARMAQLVEEVKWNAREAKMVDRGTIRALKGKVRRLEEGGGAQQQQQQQEAQVSAGTGFGAIGSRRQGHEGLEGGGSSSARDTTSPR